jgi:hypothetical protein
MFPVKYVILIKEEEFDTDNENLWPTPGWANLESF